MITRMLNTTQINKRKHWVDKVIKLSGNFGVDAKKVEQEIEQEMRRDGLDTLLGHLRLCGAIPESYGHDSSEEKLYSKYTDVVIHEAYRAMGFTSLVLTERGDAADVECVCDAFSFVADAKAFRLSRTAKNQKDFKVESMDRWKHGKRYAMIVCPVYQLPSRKSQIYEQASTRSVCICTYTHLAVFTRYAKSQGQHKAKELVHEMFLVVESMNPSKDAIAYWSAINRTILDFDVATRDLWLEEKQASLESIAVSKEEALQFIASERERIMKLSREEAVKEVLKSSKLKNKIEAIKKINDNGILEHA